MVQSSWHIKLVNRKWSIYFRSSVIALVFLALTFWLPVPTSAPAFGHGLQKLNLLTRIVVGNFCVDWDCDLGGGTEFWPSCTKNVFWEGPAIKRAICNYCCSYLICAQYTNPLGKSRVNSVLRTCEDQRKDWRFITLCHPFGKTDGTSNRCWLCAGAKWIAWDKFTC